MLVHLREACDVVMKAWATVVDCSDCEAFPKCVEKFKSTSLAWPIFLEYVQKTWIKPHKEKFVSAWTNKVMHMGNTTSNRYVVIYNVYLYVKDCFVCKIILSVICRVEQAHGNLKLILQTSMGDLCTCWDTINNLLVFQHNQIKASFKMSLNVATRSYNISLYKGLLGMVSKYALVHIAEEFNKVKFVGFDKKKCGYVLRYTHGLPCACKLARYDVGVIPLNVLHVMWIRFSFSDLSSSQSSSELSIKQE